jgi:hypothetical protein
MLINVIIPIFIVIGIGTFVRRIHLLDEHFFRASDRFVYYVSFPALLFWKIGEPGELGADLVSQTIAVFAAVTLAFLLSIILIYTVGITRHAAGSFAQGCFRFNSYVGLGVVLGALGETGLKYFGILIGFIIPYINLLCVGTLIWFSDKSYDRKTQTKIMAKAIVSNPLIIACLAGIIWSNMGIGFPGVVERVFKLLGGVTLPLALVSIGGGLSFQSLGKTARPALLATAVKLIFMPVAGYYLLVLFNVEGLAMQTAMIYFCLPTATSTYILSSLLGSDTGLASSAIMMTTLASLPVLALCLWLFVSPV